MNKPDEIKNALFAIWVCIISAVVAALLDRITNRMSPGEFAFYLIFYGFMVMVPYKLERRSNATRYVYAVMIVGSVLAWLGGIAGPLPLASKIVGVLQLPVTGFIFYWLFSGPANQWFDGSYAAAGRTRKNSLHNEEASEADIDGRVEPVMRKNQLMDDEARK